MKERLGRWLAVPEELVGRTVQLAGASCFFIAALTTTKAVRDGVFMTHFGLVGLSYAMLGMALLTAVVTAAYHGLTGVIGRRHAFVVTQLAVAASLVGLGELIARGVSWAPVALYVWSGVVGLVALAELWLRAGEIFTAFHAKRAYAVIGAAGIIGGAFGGTSARILAGRMSVRALLCLVAAELVVVVMLMYAAMRHRNPGSDGKRPRATLREALRILPESRYARTLALLVLCLTIAVTLVEWQVKGLAKAHFASNQRELVAFFGMVGAVVSCVALVLQLLGTERLLRAFGTIACLRALPSSVVAVSLGLLATIVLPMSAVAVCAIGVVFVDGLRLSLDQAASEMLYLPLDEHERAPARRLIDTIGDRAGGAITALLWLGMATFGHLDRPGRLPCVSVLVLVVVAVWLLALRRMSDQYVAAHRQLIGAPPEAPVADERLRRSVERLWTRLDRKARVRTRVLRSLNHLQRGANLGLAWEEVAPHVAREAANADVLARAARSDLASLGRAGKGLARLVEKRLARSLERVARLLALVYPPPDLAAMHRALRGSSARVRGAALELLDHMMIGPGHDQLLRVVAERFGEVPAIRPDVAVETALAELIVFDDPTVRAYAALTAARSSLPPDTIARLVTEDTSRLVRSVARLAVRRRRRWREYRPVASSAPVEAARLHLSK